MSDNSRYNRIGSIVDQWIFSNDLSSHWFKKGLSWGLWGLRELKIDVWQDTVSKVFQVSERKTVTLPPNCIDVGMVAIQRGQYLIGLGVNDNLSSIQRDGTEVASSPLLSQNLPNGINFSNYSTYTFGNGRTCYGSDLPDHRVYKVVKRDACNEIVFDLNISFTEVVVELITDGFNPCEETIVNPYFADYVLKYIEHEYERINNPNRTEASIGRAARALAYAEFKCRGRHNTIDPTTFLAITRAGVKMTPKV